MSDPFSVVVAPGIPLLDAHVHVRQIQPVEPILEGMDSAGCVRLGFVSTTRPEGNQNHILLAYKKANGERFYIFGAPDYGVAALENAIQLDVQAVAASLAESPARLKAQGFDGIKLIEGKPTARRFLPWPLDSEVYEGFFAAAERLKTPLVWHVGDPEIFWDPQRIYSAARERGWLYDRPGDIRLAAIRREAEHVLDRHPGLRVIFAHFYFLSADLNRARAVLRKYPSICFDTTPGAGMFIDFIPKLAEAREFFLEFEDRLVFGTDLNDNSYARGGESGGGRALRLARAYYATDEFMPGDFPGSPRVPEGQRIRGIQLPERTLRKFFAGNFQRLAGTKPAPLAA
ncbi:MAG: amidohydrolase family protein [Candidatus Sumerlaeota bacterium]|nr:amidohydrolase family protein [Candidatus Sumerlaeota bacterium]